MGKTVKSRTVLSITSIICVVALCIIANKGIPSLYASQREKAIAQENATRVVEQVNKPSTTAPTTQQPTTEPTTEPTVSEDSNVYEIVEDTTAPQAQEEEPTQEEEEPTQPETPASEESFFDKIIGFFTSIFEAFTSGDILTTIKDFISSLFGGIGLSF